MSTHDYPFGPQDPPSDFADRMVRAMLDEQRLEEEKPRRTGLKRGLVLSLAAIFIGASAWAGLEVSRNRAPVAAESPAAPESQPAGRAEATTPTRSWAPEPREEPPPTRPAPRRQPVVAAQTTATPPTPPPPHRVHYPRCDCATGGELCGCIE